MPWGRHLGGVPISQNALQHYPEFHGADTWGRYPARSSQGGTLLGDTLPGGYPARGYPAGGINCQGGNLPGGYPGRVTPPARYPPSQVRTGGGSLPGGYPVRTTEGVLTTRRAVCLLRSRRRTFLL